MRGISILFAIIMLMSQSLSSQISIFVDNTYQHEILADSLSGKKIIINQKTYNIKGEKLFFEINYDYETTLEKNIVAYFYDSLDRMISKEIQTVDRIPIELFQIAYHENGDTSSIKIYTPVEDSVTVSKIKMYHYDEQQRLNKVKVFDNHEILLEEQVFSYKKENLNPSSKTIYRYDLG